RPFNPPAAKDGTDGGAAGPEFAARGASVRGEAAVADAATALRGFMPRERATEPTVTPPPGSKSSGTSRPNTWTSCPAFRSAAASRRTRESPATGDCTSMRTFTAAHAPALREIGRPAADAHR